jgi:hypothetical protein
MDDTPRDPPLRTRIALLTRTRPILCANAQDSRLMLSKDAERGRGPREPEFSGGSSVLFTGVNSVPELFNIATVSCY